MSLTKLTLLRPQFFLLVCRGVATKSPEWRKRQLELLEGRFRDERTIENDKDLQPMWRDMESRVRRRRPRKLEEAGGKRGRTNVKRTDEEVWLNEGLYNPK